MQIQTMQMTSYSELMSVKWMLVKGVKSATLPRASFHLNLSKSCANA